MPPGRPQLYACAGLVFPSGGRAPPRPMATRTISHVPSVRSTQRAATCGDHRGTATASEEPLHANGRHTDSGEGRGGPDSPEDAAEELIVCAAPPTAPPPPMATTRGRGHDGAMRTLKQCLRPYEAVDCDSVLATATAAAADAAAIGVLLETGLVGAAGSPQWQAPTNSAKLDTDIWHWNYDGRTAQPRTSADGRWPGDRCTATADTGRGDHTSVYACATRSSQYLPAPKKLRVEAAPVPAASTAATHDYEGKFGDAFAAKGCAATAVFGGPPDSGVVEERCSSSPLLLPSLPVPTKCGKASAVLLSTWGTSCCGRRDSGDEDDAFFHCSTTTTTSASEADSDGRHEDDRILLQGALADSAECPAVPARSLPLPMPRHLALQKSSHGEVWRDRSPTAVPPSSQPLTAKPTKRGSGKIGRPINFYLEPRYRQHAQHMARRDLPLVESTTAPSISSTSYNAFLQLFAESSLSYCVACEVNRDGSSRATHDTTDARSRIWSIIMKYYAAHDERQRCSRAPP
ncbi:hypothetical protein, unknown function [Leishmania tarentolae]|uniref:Uncharacterized protein n=1 Tax=Leishmania tarentolae TaxID=5689 RepID=A0A640K974_LEITA|nr:hypothetical protein, unknown function [Leishmania tarentolae]